MSTLKRETTIGLAHSHTWHTLGTFGTGSLAELIEFDAPDTWAKKERETMGTPQTMYVDTGNEGPIPVKGKLPLLENSPIVLLLMATMNGADAVTGAEDPYTHEFIWQDKAGAAYISAAWEPASTYRNIPSISLTELSFANADGNWEIDYAGDGDQINTGTSAELTSATQATTSAVLTYPNTVLRINTQGGGALASPTDVLEVSNLSWKFSRPKEAVQVTGSGNITAPTEGAYPAIELMFEIPEINTLGQAIKDAYASGAEFKADITIAGSGATRGMVFNFPRLHVMKAESPLNDPVQKVNVTLKALQATAAPTGMDQVVTYWTYKCSTAASPLA